MARRGLRQPREHQYGAPHRPGGVPPRFVVAEAATGPTGEGAGARVAGVVEGAPEGRVVHEPDNPLADAQGNVRYPDIDLGAQMTHLMLAQRGYQANLAVIERARDAYQQALQLGK